MLDKERGLIRAAQGHSIKLENPELTPVLSPEHVPVAVHGTNEDAWVAIQASGCLLPMARTHVHFSTMPVQLKKGHLSAVLLRLDLARAMGEQRRCTQPPQRSPFTVFKGSQSCTQRPGWTSTSRRTTCCYARRPCRCNSLRG